LGHADWRYLQDLQFLFPFWMGFVMSEFNKPTDALGPLSLWSRDGLKLEIRKAVEAEREACALICDELVNEENSENYQNAANWCSIRIRARGEQA
jgi:hypothetical protein